MAKKLRTEQPPKYKSYKSFKPYLRREFDHTCVYCDVWESEMGGKKSFHIDHYRPKEKPQFKHLIAEYTNLLYSCRDCNEFKDDYWPNPLEWLFGLIYLDPCEYDVEEHIDKSDHEWVGRTRMGIFNVDELHLAEETKITIRLERERLQDLLIESQTSLTIALRALQLSLLRADQVAESEARAAIHRYEGLIAYCERIFQKRRD
jgi:hypothetical protein